MSRKVKNPAGEFKTVGVKAAGKEVAAYKGIQMAVAGSVRDMIRSTIAFYEMRAEAVSVLVANSEKALREFDPDGEIETAEQAKRLENSVKNLTRELDNMLTRFYFQKERKKMTGRQARALADFVNFTKSLTENVRSLVVGFQKGQTFEARIDKEIKEVESQVREKLKEFDMALSDTSDSLTNGLSKYVGKTVTAIKGQVKTLALSRRRAQSTGRNMGVIETVGNKVNVDDNNTGAKASAQSIGEGSLKELIDSGDRELEAVFDGQKVIDISGGNGNGGKAERQTGLKV